MLVARGVSVEWLGPELKLGTKPADLSTLVLTGQRQVVEPDAMLPFQLTNTVGNRNIHEITPGLGR